MENLGVKSVFANFYANKRVFITGHTGFKGAWLAFWLQEMGAEVCGYALEPQPQQKLFDLLGLEKNINHIIGDVRDYSRLKDAFEAFRPDLCFHLAAQPLVRFSYLEPRYTFETNICGTINVLEVARQSSSFLRSLVCITSDKCYYNKEWIWGYRENDEIGGVDPYSASKAAAEMVFRGYQHSFFASPETGVATVRAGNVIGGGDWSADRIVPDCIRALEQNEPIILRNPQATRPWQHVLEPLSGYLLLASKLAAEPVKYSGSWNFGPRADSVATVEALARKMLEYWGCGEVQIAGSPQDWHEAGLLQLNCEKAHQLLGWVPRWNFDETVKETATWYKQIRRGEPALAVTREQIRDYYNNSVQVR